MSAVGPKDAESGVLSLTRAMAADRAPDDVRVNCVRPSATDPPMYWQTNEAGRRERVTGQVLVADGGFTTFR